MSTRRVVVVVHKGSGDIAAVADNSADAITSFLRQQPLGLERGWLQYADEYKLEFGKVMVEEG